MENKIISEVTDEFCEAYKSKSDCRGWSSRIIPLCLPECVDPNDSRVIQIIDWCKEISSEES